MFLQKNLSDQYKAGLMFDQFWMLTIIGCVQKSVHGV